MKKNLFYILCTIFTCLFTGCTDLHDEFGLDAQIDMSLVDIIPDGKTYSAIYDINVKVDDAAGQSFKNIGIVVDNGWSNISNNILDASQVAAKGTSTVRVTLKELNFSKTYTLKPYIATDAVSLYGAEQTLRREEGSFLKTTPLPALQPHHNQAVIGIEIEDYNYSINMEVVLSTDPTFMDSKQEVSLGKPEREENGKGGTWRYTVKNLKANTTYYYCVRQRLDGGIRLGQIGNFTTGVYSNENAVDLGLSHKWASTNLGMEYDDAIKPSSCLYQQTLSNNVDFNAHDVAGTEYDLATLQWGKKWRMPSSTDFNELCEQCSWAETTQNGQNGWIVTGPNSNSIFLPTTGYIESSRNRNINTETEGRYWSGANSKASGANRYWDATVLFLAMGKVPQITYMDKRRNYLAIRPVLIE